MLRALMNIQSWDTINYQMMNNEGDSRIVGTGECLMRAEG